MKNIKLLISRVFFEIFGARGSLTKLKSDTAIISEKVLTLQTCRKIINIFEEKIADTSSIDYYWIDSLGSDIRIGGFEKYYPELLKILNIESLISQIDSYTGRKTKDWFLMVNKTVFKPNNSGSGGGWHRDSVYTHQIKVIWYLSDVNKQNGPFCYVKGSHIDRSRKSKLIPATARRLHDYIGEYEEVIGSEGTQLICDTSSLHRGKPIESGKRYAMTLYTSPKKNILKKMFK